MDENLTDIFRGVIYHLTRCSEEVVLRQLLDRHGAVESSCSLYATRLITESAHFTAVKKLKSNALIVQPEWVFSSLKTGVKRPSQYYSADPAMFLSSVVVAVAGRSPDSLGALVLKHGGQFLPRLCEEVTHLIADANTTFDLSEFCPIIVSSQWLLDSVAKKSLLPTAQYEFGGSQTEPTTTRAATPSAARRFCEVLLALADSPHDVSPVVSLPFIPFEILAKIFLTLRDTLLAQYQPAMGDLLPISHVCSRWREIAHDTKPLWTHLVVDFHSRGRYRRLLPLMEQWVARTGAHPLSLTIRSCYPSSHNPVIDFILAHAPRLGELSLTLPAAHFRPFLKIPAASFPVLETLTLSRITREEAAYDPASGMTRSEYFRDLGSFYGEPDEEILWEDFSPLTMLKNLPRLRSISIQASGQEMDSRILPLPWRSLTRIDFGDVELSVYDAAYILPLCTSARTLNFCTGPSMGPFMPVIKRVRLPVVELDWNGLGGVDAVSIFEPLVLPRLVDLRLREGCGTALFRLAERSKCALTSLYVMSVHLNLQALCALLRGMPTLVNLQLRMSISISNELLEFLTYDAAAASPILPNLENLGLADHAPVMAFMVDPGWRTKKYDEGVMLRMVESRWGATPLADVDISTTRNAPVGKKGVRTRRPVLDRVVELMEAGLKFRANNFEHLGNYVLATSPLVERVTPLPIPLQPEFAQ
ncbi:hypothetical protein C8R46DRAFT_1343932, partial [Mycena filopes]